MTTPVKAPVIICKICNTRMRQRSTSGNRKYYSCKAGHHQPTDLQGNLLQTRKKLPKCKCGGTMWCVVGASKNHPRGYAKCRVCDARYTYDRDMNITPAKRYRKFANEEERQAARVQRSREDNEIKKTARLAARIIRESAKRTAEEAKLKEMVEKAKAKVASQPMPAKPKITADVVLIRQQAARRRLENMREDKAAGLWELW